MDAKKRPCRNPMQPHGLARAIAANAPPLEQARPLITPRALTNRNCYRPATFPNANRDLRPGVLHCYMRLRISNLMQWICTGILSHALAISIRPSDFTMIG